MEVSDQQFRDLKKRVGCRDQGEWNKRTPVEELETRNSPERPGTSSKRLGLLGFIAYATVDAFARFPSWQHAVEDERMQAEAEG
jgi:hypothetical protein